MDEAVTTFRDLLRPAGNESATEGQAHARRLLPARVATSSLRWLRPGVGANGTGSRWVIGVASWSARDLELLDEIASNPPNAPVYVFDAADMDDFESVIPGLGQVFHTPVVGRWVGGQLVDRASGHAARELIRSRLLAPVPAHAPPLIPDRIDLLL